MKKLSILLIFISAFTMTSSLSATTLFSMSKAELEKLFLNRTLVSIGVDNLNGRTVHNSNWVFLDNRGNAYGKMERKPINQPQFDTGSYKIHSNGALYLKWNHWDGNKLLCFYIFETKNAFLSIDCNNVYHSTFMKADILPGNKIAG